MGLHIDAARRIRLIDLCGGSDVGHTYIHCRGPVLLTAVRAHLSLIHSSWTEQNSSSNHMYCNGIVQLQLANYCSFFVLWSSFYLRYVHNTCEWLGSRVVSVLDSGAEGPGFKSRSRRCRVSLRQTVHTHRASVHQAALVAALLRVAGVTAGLAESNGSLPSGLWFTSPAGWLPRTGSSSRTLRPV